jgi:lipoprotein-releasing system permease protein
LNFPLFIARRYLVSKKSHNAINVISNISAIGVGVGAMALIIVLSVFNGFEKLIVSLFNSFDSDLQITVAEGKTFKADSVQLSRIGQMKGIVYYTEVLEENVLLKYHDKQFIATIKGINDQYIEKKNFANLLTEGELMNADSGAFALVGQGIANALGINPNDFFTPLMVYAPHKGRASSDPDPGKAFSTAAMLPTATFSVQQEVDIKYVLVPIAVAQELLQKPNHCSSIEVGISDSKQLANSKEQLRAIMGEGFIVKDRFEQHELLYKIMKSEKWAVFFILAFILIIATFNVIGSITMIILDKQKDIIVLKSLGASNRMIRAIFLFEGFLVTFIGAVGGILLGAFICWIQQQFGVIKLNSGGGNFVVEAYPVSMELADFVYVLVTVLIIGYVTARYPAVQLVRRSTLKTRIN